MKDDQAVQRHDSPVGIAVDLGHEGHEFDSRTVALFAVNREKGNYAVLLVIPWGHLGT